MMLPILLLTAVAAARPLSTDRFANVFLETQPVRIALPAGPAATVELRDLGGVCLAKQDAGAEAATLDFGPRPPGYYEAVAGEQTLPIVVLIDPARRVPGDTRLATDNAMAWLVKPEQFDGVADLLRAAGISWVRERLSWGEVEPQRGQYQWAARYERSIDALTARGLKVYNIFHATPGWSRADRVTAAPPDDLRDIYRFAGALAKQYRGRVAGWEVWNEPDIGFGHATAADFIAFQKAAWLGFKSVDPSLLVLGPSLAGGVSPFAEHLLDNGLGAYADLWNYHVYADPEVYASRYDGFKAMLGRHGVDLPAWVTEAGARLDGPAGVLPRAARLTQAEFLSRAYPQALAAGEARHFWFVFPFYHEGNTGWGLFEPGQAAAFPGLGAMATATWALGHGDFAGAVQGLPATARALAFARGDGTLGLAAWDEGAQPAEVTLPLTWTQVTEARNHLGTPLARGDGPVTLRLTHAAVYLVVRPETLVGKLSTPPALPPATPPARPTAPTAVPRLLVTGTLDHDADTVMVSGGGEAAATAEVYNFGAEPLRGAARLEATGGLRTDRPELPLDVPAGDRVVVPVRLTVPPAFRAGTLRLTLPGASVAEVHVTADPDKIAAVSERDLQLDSPARWRTNIAGHGSMTTDASPDGGVRFQFTFRAGGDNWAYPSVDFKPPLDLSSYDALRFEYRTSVADSGPVRLMLVEPSGATYMTGAGLGGTTAWQSATVLFSSLTHLGLSTPDSNGKLDLDQLTTFRFGANCKPLSLTLELRKVRAVKLPE